MATDVGTEVIGELARQRMQIAAMQIEIAEMKLQLNRQKQQSPNGSERACEPKLADIVSITQEMFSGEPTVEVARDPEDPDVPFVVITVKWPGTAGDLVIQRAKWHERIAKLVPGNSGPIRLSVVPAS